MRRESDIYSRENENLARRKIILDRTILKYCVTEANILTGKNLLSGY